MVDEGFYKTDLIKQKPELTTQEQELRRLKADLDYGVLSRDDAGRELTTRMANVGCARLSDLLRLSGETLVAFDGDLRELRDWMLTRATGVDEMVRGRFVSKLKEIMVRYGISYVDGSDDRRWNIDLRSNELSVETRLRALLSDRRFWIFQAVDGNHELTLAVDTMIRLCQWRKFL